MATLIAASPRLFRSCSATSSLLSPCFGGGSRLKEEDRCSPLTSAVALQQHRCYTPLSPEQIKEEKQRVSTLTDFQRDQELRQYNRDIAKLEALKGINTGELFTLRGQYKQLARDYGLPMMIWYGAVWFGTLGACYVGVTVGQLDAAQLLAYADSFTGWNMASRVQELDPEYGKIGVAILLNELIEPLRLPIVVFTTKPVVDQISPPKF